MPDHTPLDPTTLSAGGAEGARSRARPDDGLARPRARCRRPISSRCSTSSRSTPTRTLAATARTTAIGLPETLLAGALADPGSIRRVLDLFAQLVGDKRGRVRRGDRQPDRRRHDDRVSRRERWRPGDRTDRDERATPAPSPRDHRGDVPEQARAMSTVDRVVELAVRNHVRVPGLAAWDEIARAIQGAPPSTPESDAVFAAAAERDAGHRRRPARRGGWRQGPLGGGARPARGEEGCPDRQAHGSPEDPARHAGQRRSPAACSSGIRSGSSPSPRSRPLA